ncbi:sensor histidine kinase [Candidatus Nitrosopumilus sediminis]|uniref:Histidine kinase n=1 Tax=Candidatus Nitrosopumilus sediminis TaxID=1229909 RepID=K0BA38_9ARCH|nr:HAMP domain-containing sensor histidine kinase [Candidatus Nitrosopumilus sediminis]AFS81897.1 histidine kinase [Candidatus Nitrosopumilus sediminis]
MSESILKTNLIDNKRILIWLIVTLVGFTILYQLRPFLDDDQFMWISIPAYAILPALMASFAMFIAVKLHKQKNPNAKAFVFFALGSVFWFIAEQLWQLYDHVWQGDPFPSEADIFYIASYPCYVIFLLIHLKPTLKSVNRNVWLFAIALSFSFLIPSIMAAYEDMQGEDLFSTSIALAYPILSSVQLVPAIVGIMYLVKKSSHVFWVLIIIGFIMYNIADTYFLFAELDGTYYDGHPVDLIFVYGFIFFIFSLYHRSKFIPISDYSDDLFSEKVKFETITKFGIPLTVAIVCMVVLTILINSTFDTVEQDISHNLFFGVVAILGVVAVIVFTINKNLSRLVKMRTAELTEQRDNLENLVEEKTQQVLKSERLSAIGELSGRLAHDLRNPLSVMKMSVDLIKQSPQDLKISDPNIVKRVELIEKSINRISHQVNDVLGYVRLSPLKLSNVSLYDAISGSLKKINIPSDVQVVLPQNDMRVDCDVIKLDAVFINLIVNAIQELPQGGKITIQISEKDNAAILKFIDSGKGIPDEDISKVFEPLFTTKQKGTGLGLASCKNIIEQHHGEISVTNNPTTFTIILPKMLSIKHKKSK